MRAVAPFAVVAVVWLVTGIAHAISEPNLNEPGTLSPTGTGDHGSSRLAEMLRSRGVAIERVTSARLALQAAAASGDATVFVPAPDYLDPTFVAYLADVPGAHRVVVVRPGLRTQLFSGLPIYSVGARWATATLAPGCSTPYAARAGPAAVRHDTYVVDGDPASVDCYSGSLVGMRERETETIYIGASDPFRNDRIGESGNASLATALLSEYGRLVWVDVHVREPVSLSPVDVPDPELPEYRRGDRERADTGFPTIDAFPPVLWATLVVLFVAAVLLALARARRLGPPVTEPLPVLVPAAESVTGRGRLYLRIGAREATLEAIRGAAISAIARVLNPFGGAVTGTDLTQRELIAGGPTAQRFVTQVAERASASEHAVRAILYGPVSDDDEALARAVADLDALVDAVLRDNPSASIAEQPFGGTP